MSRLGTVADKNRSASGAASSGTRNEDAAPDGAKITIRNWNYKDFAPDGAGEGRRLGLIWDRQRHAHCDGDAFGFTWFDPMGPGVDFQWFRTGVLDYGAVNLVLPGLTGACPAWVPLPTKIEVPAGRHRRARGMKMPPRMGLRLLLGIGTTKISHLTALGKGVGWG
jgi:hypothetical protein